MHIESHEVFCAVVEHGSLSRAAHLLHMTQSTASRHLQVLEEEYGGLLFERSASGLTLTSLGHALYPFSRDMLSCHMRAKEEIFRLRSQGGGLCVGATLSIGEYVLPELLGELKKQYPLTEIRMRIANTAEVLRLLIHHSIDIGIVEGQVKSASDFQITEWMEDDLVLVCPPFHPFVHQSEVTLQEVLQEPLLCREEGSGTRQITEQALDKAGVLDRVSFMMELGSTQAIKSAITAGLGIAFLSRLVIREDCLNGTLVEIPVSEFRIHRKLYIVQRQERYARYMVAHFLSLLLKESSSSKHRDGRELKT